jgi:FtsZ-binding cell division protein ZapB
LTRTPPLTASAAASRAAEITTLQNQLSSAQQNISALSASHTSLQSLITDYENALTLLLDKLRPYAYNQTSSILALHKHYQALLEQERSTSMQMRLEHAEWQAGLGRVADYARQALKVQGQREEPLQREIKELKEENRVLRRLAGWEEKDDSSEDEDDKA